jgi:hypothetical protein
MSRSASRLDKKDASAGVRRKPRWTVNEPGDRWEREADRVAEDVTRGQTPGAAAPASAAGETPSAGLTRFGASGAPGSAPVQRKCAACASGGVPCPTCSDSADRLSAAPSAVAGLGSGKSAAHLLERHVMSPAGPPTRVIVPPTALVLASPRLETRETVSGRSPGLASAAKGSGPSPIGASLSLQPAPSALVQRQPVGPGRDPFRTGIEDKAIDVETHMAHFDKFFALAVVLRGGHPLDVYKRILRAGEGKERGVFRGALQVANWPPRYPRLIQLPSEGKDLLITGDPAREFALQLFTDELMRWAGDHLQDPDYLRQDPISVAAFLLEYEGYGDLLHWAALQPLEHEYIDRNELLPGEVLASFGKTVGIGLLMIAAVGLFVGAEIITAGQATWLLVGLAGYAGVDSYLSRREEIEKTGYDVPIPETVVASAGDVVGVSQVLEGMSGHRLGTGEKLGSKARSQQLGTGSGVVTTLLIGSRAYRAGQGIGRTWRLSLPAKTPSGPYGAITDPIPAAEIPTVPTRNPKPGPVETGVRKGLSPDEQIGLDILIENIAKKGNDPEIALAKMGDAIARIQARKHAVGYRARVERFREIKSMEARATDDPLNPRLKNREWRDNIEVRYENKPPSQKEIAQAQDLARNTGEHVTLFGDTPAGIDFPGIDGTIGIPPRPLSLKNAAPEWARWHAQEAIAKAADHGYSKVTVHLRVRGALAEAIARWDSPPPKGKKAPTFRKGIIAEILLHADDGSMSMAPPMGPPLVPPALPGGEPEQPEIQRAARPAPLPDTASATKGSTSGQVPADVLRGLGGNGRPLNDVERSYFEPRFARDLSAVRIHTDTPAHDVSRELSARAFTAGNHIAFARGEYAPESASGRRLLAHELAHVVQQAGGDRAAGPVDPSRTAPPRIQRFEAAVHENVERAALTAGPGGFSHQEATATYFGNWMRDMNQAFVPFVTETVDPQLVFALISYLAQKKFGIAPTPETFGYYVPSEHLDSPAGLSKKDLLPEQPKIETTATTGFAEPFNTPQDDPLPGSGEVLGTNIFKVDQTGTMAFIRRTNLVVERRLRTAVSRGRTPQGLLHFGAALHAVEDLFSHSNFIEIALDRVLSQRAELLPDLKGEARRVQTFSPMVYRPPEAEGRPVLTTGSFIGTDTQISLAAELVNVLNKPPAPPSSDAEATAEERLTYELLRAVSGRLRSDPEFREKMRQLILESIQTPEPSDSDAAEKPTKVRRQPEPGKTKTNPRESEPREPESPFQAIIVDRILQLPLHEIYDITRLPHVPRWAKDAIGITTLQQGIRNLMHQEVMKPTARHLEAAALEARVHETSLLFHTDQQKRKAAGTFTAAEIAAMEATERAGGETVAEQSKAAKADAAERFALLLATPQPVVAGPSHSQVAKDHIDNPFFGLAFRLASAAVGRLRERMIAAWEEKLPGRFSTPFHFTPRPKDEEAAALYDLRRAAEERGASRGHKIFELGGALDPADYDLAAMRRESAQDIRAIARALQIAADSPNELGVHLRRLEKRLGTASSKLETKKAREERNKRWADELARAANRAATASEQAGTRIDQAAQLRELAASLGISAGKVEKARTLDEREAANRRLLADRDRALEALAKHKGMDDAAKATLLTAITRQVHVTSVSYSTRQRDVLAGTRTEPDMPQTGRHLELSYVDLPGLDKETPAVRGLLQEARLLLNHPYESDWWHPIVTRYIEEYPRIVSASIEARNAGYLVFRRKGKTLPTGSAEIDEGGKGHGH